MWVVGILVCMYAYMYQCMNLYIKVLEHYCMYVCSVKTISVCECMSICISVCMYGRRTTAHSFANPSTCSASFDKKLFGMNRGKYAFWVPERNVWCVHVCMSVCLYVCCMYV